MRYLSLCLCLLTFLTFSCQKKIDVFSTKAESSIEKTDQVLASKIYSSLCKTKGSFVFSPWSVGEALALIYPGAKGETAEGIKSIFLTKQNPQTLLKTYIKKKELFLKTLNQSEMKWKNPSALWAQEGTLFEKDYLNLFTAFQEKEALHFANFKTEPQEVEYLINNWVSQATQGELSTIVAQGQVNQNTRLVLTTALYFQGKWASPFPPQNSKTMSFYSHEEIPYDQMMMKQKAIFNLCEKNDYSVLELPYLMENKELELSLCVVLPEDKNGLRELESTISENFMNEWVGQLSPQNVEVLLPSFTLENMGDWSQLLSQLGMSEAFSPTANFSGISQKENLSLGFFNHNAKLSVDEEGTEASAASSGGFIVTSTGAPNEKYKLFTADHPFLFYLIEKKSQTILFMGRFLGENI
jgi:serpin B